MTSRYLSETELLNMNFIGKYVRDPSNYFKECRILGRVTEVLEIGQERFSSYYRVTVKTTHTNRLNIEGVINSDRFGEYIGSRYAIRIYLEKSWRKSCASCACVCKRGKICSFHSDGMVTENG